jgi:hypothetical protein
VIYKDILMCMVIYGIGNLVVWFQLNGQFKWDFWKDNIVVVGLMGIPISIAFFYATKLSYTGFDGLLWPGRLVAFGISMVSFTFCTWYFLGEVMTLRSIASMILAFVIILLQLIK